MNLFLRPSKFQLFKTFSAGTPAAEPLTAKALAAALAVGLTLGSSSWGQDGAKPSPPTEAQAAVAPDKSDRDETVPEKIVPEKEAIQQLSGNYRIVSGESSGKQILPERLTDVTVRITEKTITTYDGDRHQRFSASYRLDTQRRPWRIFMVSQPKPPATAAGQNAAPTATGSGTTSQGLIELTEKGAKVIYALPSGETPRDFKTGELQQLFVLERLPDPTQKAQGPTGPATAEGSNSDK